MVLESVSHRISAKALKQGQGISTEFKERGLQAAFTINLRIFQNRFGGDKYPYFHFDLNCGTGWNDESNCIGSPLAFLQATQNTGCNRFFAGFCDIDDNKLKLLFSRPELQNKNCWSFHGDNSELPYAIPGIIRSQGDNPKMAIGMVLVDPNGYNIPLEPLVWLSKECPKLDVVINWNSTAAKRNRYNPISGGDHVPTLEQVIENLNKKYWLIRKPMTAHQFTLLIGRNFSTGDHKSLGFYHLNSMLGQDIFAQCNFTREQLKTRYDDLQRILLSQEALAL